MDFLPLHFLVRYEQKRLPTRHFGDFFFFTNFSQPRVSTRIRSGRTKYFTSNFVPLLSHNSMTWLWHQNDELVAAVADIVPRNADADQSIINLHQTILSYIMISYRNLNTWWCCTNEEVDDWNILIVLVGISKMPKFQTITCWRNSTFKIGSWCRFHLIFYQVISKK